LASSICWLRPMILGPCRILQSRHWWPSLGSQLSALSLPAPHTSNLSSCRLVANTLFGLSRLWLNFEKKMDGFNWE
jgi:hypothetical protein